MEYLATASLDIEGKDLLQFDIFEVDTDVYFACPRVPHTSDQKEFYFARVGSFWQTEPPVYFWVLEAVREALGFQYNTHSQNEWPYKKAE